MSDLNPCPHCGELPDIVETNSGFQALCSGCDMATYSDDWTEEKAIEIWNARHSGWISVDDRLPEKYSWYLIVSSTKATMAFYDGDTVNEDGGLWLVHNDNPDNDEWENVTHWMPLPEPPKQ